MRSSPMSTTGVHFSSLQTPPDICPQRTTGPSKSQSTSNTYTAPATRSPTAAPTQVILTSTTANDATTMITSCVAPPLSYHVRRSPKVRRSSEGRHYATRCHAVNIRTTRFTSFLPTVPRPPVRLYVYELYIFSCFLALLIVDGRSNCPLGT